MYRILRIVFCLLAVAAAAVAIFVFVYAGWMWGLGVVGVCVLFAALMFICKSAQEREELKKNPPPPVGDFITGRVKSENSEKKD